MPNLISEKIEINSDDDQEFVFVRHASASDPCAADGQEPAGDVVALPDSLPTRVEPDLIEVCTDTSNSESSEDNANEFNNAGEKVFAIPKAPEGYRLWQHKKSKILHLMKNDYKQFFECGRKIGQFHTENNVITKWDSGICWNCFKEH